MEIIEGPAGYSADSILIRYQVPCTEEDQDVEGDNPLMYRTVIQQQQPGYLVDDDNMTVKSTSTTGSASTTIMMAQQAQAQEERVVRRRQQARLRRQQRLDKLIWYVLENLSCFACKCRRLSLRFVGCQFPAPALAWWLKHSPQLHCLQLRITLAGPLSGLAKALQDHPQLNEVTFDHCFPSLSSENNPDLLGTIASRKERGHKGHPSKSIEQHKEEYEMLDKSKLAAGLQKKRPPNRLASLEPLLDAISHSRTLRSLTLSHTTIAFWAEPASNADNMTTAAANNNSTSDHSPIVWNAGVSMANLLKQSRSLRKLSLEHMDEIQDRDFAFMMTALEEPSPEPHKKSHLETLNIRQCAVGPLAGKALGKMIATNTSLNTLDVNIHWWDGLSYEETGIGEYVAQCRSTDVNALIEGLATNQKLLRLGLYGDNVTGSRSAAIVAMLGEEVERSVEELCAKALTALPKIFQTPPASDRRVPVKRLENRTLEDIIVGHRSFGLSPDIDFYLNWNRAGRDYFCEHENACSDDWISTIMNNREDLSVIYALLSTRPSIFGHQS